MKNLQPVEIDSLDIFKKVANAKHLERKTRLIALCEPIQKRFLEYETSKLELSTITKSQFMDEVKLADLIHCYDGTTQPLNELLAKIKIVQPSDIRQKCQFCGIDSPTTWDHYLPKTEYPEFSIHPLNLMPCCSTCNEKKGITFLLDGEREIINLYFDYLPTDEQYLHVEIEYHQDIPIAKYKLLKPSNLQRPIFELIKRHYKRLGLLTRYQENSPEVFSETMSSIKAHHVQAEDRFETVKEWLIIEANRLKKRFSANHWKAALHEEMANSVEYINSCLV